MAYDQTKADLLRENTIMSKKLESSLANNLCPDHRDKQAGKPCLACEIDRLRNALERIRSTADSEEEIWEGPAIAAKALQDYYVSVQS